jgi:hypothetical protein
VRNILPQDATVIAEDENEIGEQVIATGMLDVAYEACLQHELEKRKLNVQTQVLLPPQM